jgi:thioredoxin reductase
MTTRSCFDVIIIGGSFSGLSAGLTLGRSLRNVLIIDSGKPCNEQASNAYNFLTQDGRSPREILSVARSQIEQYRTVQFHNGVVIEAKKLGENFKITTKFGATFTAKKIIIATGLKYIFPGTMGFSECWGISILHCPYCHGYEFKDKKTGVLVNGDSGFGVVKFLSNWTKNLTILTQGKKTMTDEQLSKIQYHDIQVIEEEIHHFEHKEGQLQNVVLKNDSKVALNVLYSMPKFEQSSTLASELGCDFNEQGLIIVDKFQRTSAKGVFASGDNSNWAKTLAVSVAAGNIAGTSVNNELNTEDFF